MQRKGNPHALWVGMQVGTATVENSMEFPQKFKNGTVFWPNDPTFGNISKERWNTNLKEYIHPYVHCSIIYNSPNLEMAQVPISRWVDKNAMVHLPNGIMLHHKKKRSVSSFLRQHGGPDDYYVMWNKPVRGKQVPYDLTSIWNRVNKTI